MSKIIILDSTLRDGSHAVAHQFSLEQVTAIAAAAEKAGIDILEVGHGDGLAGSSIQYGRELVADKDKLQAAVSQLRKTRLGILLLPGIGTREDLKMAVNTGVKVARIATHATEADIGEQHIYLAKELGMDALGALMMSHMVTVEKLVEQALLFEGYGADGVYLMDSAGAMIPKQVQEKVTAVASALKIPVGFHAHNNLSLAVINSIVAIQAGAKMIDCTMKGLGAGAGNTPLEVLTAVMEKYGIASNINLFEAMDAAEYVIKPLLQRPLEIDKTSLLLGYAGVYSSFLLHAYRAAEKFNMDPQEILLELGRRKMVGGQEDMIIGVAFELSKGKD